MCLGVDDALAAAVPLTDVLFDINNLGIFVKEETVNPFMDGIVTATVMDAAAGDNFNFRTLTDVEIIINHLRHTILCNQRRDVYVFIFGKGLYINIQTGAALLGDDINIFCGMSALALAVVADVKCSICRDFRNAGNLLQKVFYDIIEHHSSPPLKYLQPVSMPNRPGRTSSFVPICFTSPALSRTT